MDKIENFKDKRGVIMFAYPEGIDFDYKYLTIGTINKDSERGGHYHNKIKEKILCVAGKMFLQLQHKDSNVAELLVLNEGDIADIPPEHIHTMWNNNKETVFFVEFKSEVFNKEDSDTYKA